MYAALRRLIWRWFAVVSLLLPATPVAGQLTGQLTGQFCGTDFTSPEAVAAHNDFREAKNSGFLNRLEPHKSYDNPPDIGFERAFNVRVSSGWEARIFRLVDKTAIYYLWTDVTEIAAGNMPSSYIDTIRNTAINRTPRGSIDPGKGIFRNNNDVFGSPPNYDGDGMIDLLLYDIKMGFVIGYVSAVDVSPNAPDGAGNQADVLYLDSNEGFRNPYDMSAIIAHEYTHLIHINYGWDLTFIMEGIAEYAIVMNGYSWWRPINYINHVDEYRLPLFSWRTVNTSTRDYQRGSHFFTYMSEKMSPWAAGRVLRSDRKGASGFSNSISLDGMETTDLLRGFHTANLLNDTGINFMFGHSTPGREDLVAPLTYKINGEIAVFGEVEEEGADYATYRPEDMIGGGSVHYVQWDNVADMWLLIDALGYQALPDAVKERIKRDMQSRINPRIIGTRPDGSIEIFDIEASEYSQQFSGKFTKFVMILVHTDPGIQYTRVTYTAEWTPLSKYIPTGIDKDPEIPVITKLTQWPNPFVNKTNFSFTTSEGAAVRLTVWDMQGRTMIDNTVYEYAPAGYISFGLNTEGWASGIYIYNITVGKRVRGGKMVVTRAP